MNKVKLTKCKFHPENKDLTDYYFYCTDIRYKYPKDIYVCKKCKDQLDKDLDRERRIRKNNYLQLERSRISWQLKSNKIMEKRNKSIKEDLWDCEVRRILYKGMKQPWLIEFPKPMLQLARATIRLQRLIKKIKDKKAEERTIEQEREKKLKSVLVNCKKHGALFLEDVIKGGKSRWTDEQRYKCRYCMKDTHKKYYERNKEYVKQKCFEYKKNNPEKVKELRINYRRKKIG